MYQIPKYKINTLIEYLCNQSFWLDLKIILKIIVVVLFGEGKFVKQHKEVGEQI